MAGGISSSEQQYEEARYSYKDAYTRATHHGYLGSWDQFMSDYLKMITDRNFKLRGDK